MALRLQSPWVRVGEAIARQPLVLPQVSRGFCHLLDWKSAPKPIAFLPVLSIVETELGTGRKRKELRLLGFLQVRRGLGQSSVMGKGAL